MKTIAIIDDHPLVLDGIGDLLSSCEDLAVVGKFTSFEDFYASTPVGMDVLVADYLITGRRSLLQFGEFREAFPRTPIVIYTGTHDKSDIQRLFSFNSNGLVFKSDATQELITAVRAVAKGENYLSPEAREMRVLHDVENVVETINASKLTRREKEILKLVGTGLTAKQVAKNLHISVWTVTNHKANIMGKLGIHSQVGLARYAIGAGMIDS